MSSITTYELRDSARESKGLELFEICTFKGRVVSDELIQFYRYQGTSFTTGEPEYRDIDGNFKPRHELTNPRTKQPIKSADSSNQDTSSFQSLFS